MSVKALSDTEIVTLIEKAKQVFPELTKSGFPQPDRASTYTRQPGSNMMFDFDVTAHHAERRALTNAESIAEFRSAMAYLNFDGGPVLTDKISYARTSYGWKHVAEAWAEAHGHHPYISNGVMIAAAYTAGVRIERIEANPNVRFNLSRVMEPSEAAFRKVREAAYHTRPSEFARLNRDGFRHGRNKADWPPRRKVA